jgi:hypothetical protein
MGNEGLDTPRSIDAAGPVLTPALAGVREPTIFACHD